MKSVLFWWIICKYAREFAGMILPHPLHARAASFRTETLAMQATTVLVHLLIAVSATIYQSSREFYLATTLSLH